MNKSWKGGWVKKTLESWVGGKNLGMAGGWGNKSWKGGWVKQALESWEVGKNLGEVGG